MKKQYFVCAVAAVVLFFNCSIATAQDDINRKIQVLQNKIISSTDYNTIKYSLELLCQLIYTESPESTTKAIYPLIVGHKKLSGFNKPATVIGTSMELLRQYGTCIGCTPHILNLYGNEATCQDIIGPEYTVNLINPDYLSKIEVNKLDAMNFASLSQKAILTYNKFKPSSTTTSYDDVNYFLSRIGIAYLSRCSEDSLKWWMPVLLKFADGKTYLFQKDGGNPLLTRNTAIYWIECAKDLKSDGHMYMAKQGAIFLSEKYNLYLLGDKLEMATALLEALNTQTNERRICGIVEEMKNFTKNKPIAIKILLKTKENLSTMWGNNSQVIRGYVSLIDMTLKELQ